MAFSHPVCAVTRLEGRCSVESYFDPWMDSERNGFSSIGLQSLVYGEGFVPFFQHRPLLVGWHAPCVDGEGDLWQPLVSSYILWPSFCSVFCLDEITTFCVIECGNIFYAFTSGFSSFIVYFLKTELIHFQVQRFQDAAVYTEHFYFSVQFSTWPQMNLHQRI